MSRRVPALVAALCLAAGAFLIAPAAAGADPALTAPSSAWLRTQQQPDGGFETQGFPGFETPDAVLALAAQAQTGAWSTATARDAVFATTNGAGKNPLDALDAWADTGLTRGQAAKLIALVAVPLGLDPSDFDWACNGGVGADPQAVLGAADADGSFGPASQLNATLYGAIATRAITGSVAPATVAFIKAAQEANGSWNYDGNPAGTDLDIDTTGLALQALAAAGLTTGDPSYDAGVAFLAAQQQANGAWQAFGADDPNSTAVALIALVSAPGAADVAAGRSWLAAQVQPDGHIASPNDTYGVSTFATSQGIQAIQFASAGGSGLPGSPALTVKASASCAAIAPPAGPPTANPPAVITATPTRTEVAGEATGAATLPRTGGGTDGTSGWLIVIGLAALGSGAGLVRVRRVAGRRSA